MAHGAPAHPRGSRHTNTYLGVAKQVSPDPIHSMDTHRNSSYTIRMNLWIYGAGQDRERKKITRTCTTRYVTLVSVVLALALTAALAACGSDEPSGGTGPDRTASTPTETPASPTRTPSTPVPSPTATDAPGTAAATAPPAVSGSAETDREALVALYNATNGENWR